MAIYFLDSALHHFITLVGWFVLPVFQHICIFLSLVNYVIIKRWQWTSCSPSLWIPCIFIFINKYPKQLCYYQWNSYTSGIVLLLMLVNWFYFSEGVQDLLPKSLLKSMYVSFLAGCFRSVRFGLEEAHG